MSDNPFKFGPPPPRHRSPSAPPVLWLDKKLVYISSGLDLDADHPLSAAYPRDRPQIGLRFPSEGC
ncbi:hypothetical protein FIBSPDRAFT_877161 [Athelia psychrophila]|uniref:Uncharacterized protein n=1 Tax=Athelia psychrophila TaxID=1759441 RepID=A0A167W7K2_9AGAM|nr:hypothetical protein FIBSPDRAFT_877161 [Fibularhizoctonia sp. CBS 109695]